MKDKDMSNDKEINIHQVFKVALLYISYILIIKLTEIYIFDIWIQKET